MRLNRAHCLALLLAIPCGSTLAKEAPAEKATDFIRFIEAADSSKLQTAVVQYSRPDGVTIDLIGVIHIGDEAYYKTLNESFKAYDSLLFEMVGADTDEPLTKEVLRGDKKNPLRFFQLLIGGMMELSFQLEHIDYTARNFVHADLNLETFTRLQKERGENIFALMEKSLKAQEKAAAEGKKTFDFAAMFRLLNEESTPNGMKLALAHQFENIEPMIAGMEGQEGSVLVAERNRAALEVMTREIKAGKKKLALFYGAAHLGDFDKRLREDHGFKLGETSWNTAWDIEAAEKAGADDAEKPAEAPAKKAA